jgi:serine protease inhibitor
MMSSILKDEKLKYVNISYKGLNDKLVAKTDTGVTLSIANRLFGNQMYTLLDSFTKRALEYYGSEMKLLDFATEHEQSRIKINNWIASQTKDKILDMIPENILDANTLLVLANAIYFKGAWQRPFDQKQTTKMNFVVDENHHREVDMMFAEYMALSGKNAEFSCKALQLPYGDGQLSMVFMLPNDKGGIKILEDRLTFDSFHSIVSGLHDQKTMIHIPKFIVEGQNK